MLNTYTSYTLITRDIDKSIDRVEKDPVTARETKYYLDNITKVKTIDEFVNNDRLFKYAMKAYGLEDMSYAKAFMKKVLKEGISDPDSFANKLTDKRYTDFAAAFNFEKYGANATTFNRAVNDAPTNYVSAIQLSSLTQGLGYIQGEVTNYIQNIGSVQSIDDLMGNSRLLYVAMGAFGLDATKEDPAKVRQMLEGGVTSPNSPANQLADKRYANFVTAFNFVENGAATTTKDAVRNVVPGQFTQATGIYMVAPRAEYVKAEGDYYKANIGKVKTIDGLLNDKRLLSVAMSAYGLDADTEDPKKVRQMLQGGVTDPTSPANLLTDKRYANFVAAFDFAQYGVDATSRDVVQKDTLQQYTLKSNAGLIKPNKDYMAAETAYYTTNVVKIDSIDDLLTDKRMLSYALTAYGLDPGTSAATVRTMLEGGVRDEKSPANTSTVTEWKAFVTAFDFERYGDQATTFNPAQSQSVDKFMRQTLEENAGKQNEGVRLALYFERKSPGISNWYEVLADTALSKVVRTALGVPESFATADIDKQVAFFESKMDIKDLQDPQKLDKFMKKFTSLWEVSNPSAGSATSLVSVLFSQPTTAGISTDTLFALQSLRLR